MFTVGRGGINSIFSAIRDTCTPLTYVGHVVEAKGAYLSREGSRTPLPGGARVAFQTGPYSWKGSGICDIGLECCRSGRDVYDGKTPCGRLNRHMPASGSAYVREVPPGR